MLLCSFIYLVFRCLYYVINWTHIKRIFLWRFLEGLPHFNCYHVNFAFTMFATIVLTLNNLAVCLLSLLYTTCIAHLTSLIKSFSCFSCLKHIQHLVSYLCCEISGPMSCIGHAKQAVVMRWTYLKACVMQLLVSLLTSCPYTMWKRCVAPFACF